MVTPEGKAEALVKDLKEGDVMQFRVKAVNKAGESPASEETAPHTVKHRKLKPQIDRANLKPVTIKAGRSVKLEVDVRGEPPPKIEWFFGDRKVLLSNDDHHNIENVDYHTSFNLTKATEKCRKVHDNRQE